MGDTTAFAYGTEYTWHDIQCTSSGDYTRIYTGGSDSGCDSFVTLHLTIANSDPDTVYLNPGSGACNYSWKMTGDSLPQAYPCSSGYEFAGWSPVPITDDSTSMPNPLFLKDSICPPNYDTLYAVYKKCTGNDAYERVTAPPANGDWSGEYLIANGDYVIFNGKLQADALPVSPNHTNIFAADLANGSVPSGGTTTSDQYRFIITGTTDNWNIQSASGYYIYYNGTSNGLNTSPQPSTSSTIIYNNDETVDIICNTNNNTHLRFFNGSTPNDSRFRFYKAGTTTYQNSTGPIYLYKKTPAPAFTAPIRRSTSLTSR